MTTQLTHKGLVWIARKTESDEDQFTGSTPEVAIRKLWANYPEMADSEVTYVIPRSVVRSEVLTDLNRCPTCKKPVVFIKAMKPNGWTGIIAIHSDDDLPEDAVWNIPVLKEYKKEILRKLHKEPAKPKLAIQEVSETIPEITENQVVVPKPKIVIARPRYEAEVLAERPIVNIDGLKHNRFAVIGQIVNKLRDNIPEPQLKSIRSDLMTHGKDLNTLSISFLYSFSTGIFPVSIHI